MGRVGCFIGFSLLTAMSAAAHGVARDGTDVVAEWTRRFGHLVDEEDLALLLANANPGAASAVGGLPGRRLQSKSPAAACFCAD